MSIIQSSEGPTRTKAFPPGTPSLEYTGYNSYRPASCRYSSEMYIRPSVPLVKNKFGIQDVGSSTLSVIAGLQKSPCIFTNCVCVVQEERHDLKLWRSVPPLRSHDSDSQTKFRDAPLVAKVRNLKAQRNLRVSWIQMTHDFFFFFFLILFYF